MLTCQGEEGSLPHTTGNHDEVLAAERRKAIAERSPDRQILTRQLLEPPSISGSVRNTEVSDSDRKMLEALGYVE